MDNTDKINIKNIIRQETQNCATDVAYFVKKYCQIQHPQRGRIPFILYPFQEKVTKLFSGGSRYLIINKGRQLGISTLIAAYALWLILFFGDKNVLVIATKQDTAKNMITKVQFMYDNLPSWLKLPSIEYNKLSLKLKNGSQIKAVSAAGDSGRSEAVSLLIIDECAFIEDIDSIFPSAQKTLATGGNAIIVSTPKGVGNWFHINFSQAEEGKNGMIPIKLPWYLHPERDQTYRDQEDILLGKKMAAQENDCDFMSSGDTVIDPEIIKWYKENMVEEPMEKRGITGDYWLWKEPDYSKSYMLIADTARGDGTDYSTFIVIDVVDFNQVAEYKSQLDTRDFARKILAAGVEWNNALIVIENTGIGWDVVQSIMEANYPNIYYSIKSMGDITPEKYIDKFDRNQTTPGFTNSTKTRPLVIAKLKECLHDKSFGLKSSRTISELETFIWDGGKAGALRGYNDDLCICLGIGSYSRDISLRFNQFNTDISIAAVNSIHKTQPYDLLMPSLKYGHNPWEMKIGDKTHDLKWLL